MRDAREMGDIGTPCVREMMEDIVGLGKAAEKLLEVVSRGVGTLYRPRAIRMEADARAYETRVLGKATAEVDTERARLAVLAELDRTTMPAGTEAQLAERARERFLRRELKRQRNIESITDAAFEELPEDVSDVPVDDDWCRRFFNVAEDVSDASIQVLWARVLAGEVSRPGSFAIRTLSVLRDLTHAEAQAFEAACNLCFDEGYLLQPPQYDAWSVDWLSQFGLSHENLLALQEAGLIHDAEATSPFMKATNSLAPANLSLAACYQGSIVRFTTVKPQNSFEFVAVRFTTAGLQLSRLIQKRMNEAFLQHAASAYGATVEVSSKMP